MHADHFIIAKRYAGALFSLSSEQSASADVEKDLRVLAEAAERQPEFVRFLHSPLLARGVKAKAMRVLLDRGNAHALTMKFIERLAQNSRLGLLPLVARAFFKLLMESRGEMQVNVTSAKPLNNEDISALSAALGAYYGKKALVQSTVDAGLIGGVVINIDDALMDYSVAGQLARLNTQLKHAPLGSAA